MLNHAPSETPRPRDVASTTLFQLRGSHTSAALLHPLPSLRTQAITPLLSRGHEVAAQCTQALGNVLGLEVLEVGLRRLMRGSICLLEALVPARLAGGAAQELILAPLLVQLLVARDSAWQRWRALEAATGVYAMGVQRVSKLV